MGRAPRRNAALALGMAALIVTGGAETPWRCENDAGGCAAWLVPNPPKHTRSASESESSVLSVMQRSAMPIFAHSDLERRVRGSKAEFHRFHPPRLPLRSPR